VDKDAALKLALAFIERVNREGWVLADFEREMYAAMDAIKKALGWQGLTDDDVNEITKDVIAFKSDVVVFIREAEAKLKEKNA